MRTVVAFLFPERGALLLSRYGVVAAVGAAIGLALAMSHLGQQLEWAAYDLYSRLLAGSNEPAPEIVVVAIDEPSFAEIAQPWPWPRLLHATLIDQLAQAGARSITFDIVFDTPAGGDVDEAFAGSIARAGNVILAADDATIEDRAYALQQWTMPETLLANAAKAIGGTRVPLDDDLRVRRALLQHDGHPSLPLASASQVAGFRVPPGLDPNVAQLFRFNGPSRQGIRTVSYYQALDAANLLPRDIFRDKHVLVGLALGAAMDDTADQFSTPVGRMSGVEIHATILDALLRRRFLARPFGQRIGAAMFCVALSAALALALFRLGPAAGVSLTATTLVLLAGGGYVSLASGVHLPSVGPAIAVVSTYAITAVYGFALVSRERRMIRRAFQHYVAPAIVKKMLDDPSQLKLGGEQYEVTILFSDLEGFTTFAERLPATALSAHLGEYFQEMLDVLLPYHGTLDKLIGDSIMIYFGCPLPDPDHAINACRGALAMQERMRTLNDRWSRRGLPTLRTRVGLNTGTVVAGNMGTTGIFNFTVIGDCVNLASRLEGANKEYGTCTIIGEESWRRVSALFDGRELDTLRVKGKSQAVTIYELAAEKGRLHPAQRDAFAHFAEGLRQYRLQNWSDAAASFARALEHDPTDGPSRTFAARCARYRQEPPPHWDGIHVMEG
jgi:adenylate cyclase